MDTEISRRLFTVHDYYRMVGAGILGEKDRVELIRGEILEMSPIRTIKADLYAEMGVPEYWVADIPNDCVWAYSEARATAYSTIHQLHRGDSIVPKLLPECRIPVDIVLP
jgi:Uma2 family endonuclease